MDPAATQAAEPVKYGKAWRSRQPPWAGVQRLRGSLRTEFHRESAMLRTAEIVFVASAMLRALLPVAQAADGVQPEIQRESASPQSVGQLHTLRTIPEACVRLQGQFTADPAAPYGFEAVQSGRCAQRAVYVAVSGLKQAPTTASGWILNDRISVPRADAPACVAVVEIWRRPGDATPPKLDPQGRSRLYLDKPQQAVAAPLFTAVLLAPKSCG